MWWTKCIFQNISDLLLLALWIAAAGQICGVPAVIRKDECLSNVHTHGFTRFRWPNSLTPGKVARPTLCAVILKNFCFNFVVSTSFNIFLVSLDSKVTSMKINRENLFTIMLIKFYGRKYMIWSNGLWIQLTVSNIGYNKL